MGAGLTPVAAILASMPQVLVDIYRMRRDGSVPEQLEHATRLHLREQEHSSKLQLEQAVFEAGLQLAVSRATAEEAASPFGHLTDNEVRRQIAELTGEGRRPVLLVAPFLDPGLGRQANIDGLDSHSLAFRDSWGGCDWRADMDIDAGLITVPLLRMDLSVRHIGELVADLPVVLVHGFIDETGSARPEVIAWNLVGAVSRRRFHIPIPGPGAGDGRWMACVQVCAAVAEWFYVAQGRIPRRHQELPADLARQTAVCSLVAISLGLERGYLKPATALVHRAVLHAYLGEIGVLRETAESALEMLSAVGTESVIELADRVQQLRLLRKTVTDTGRPGQCDLANLQEDVSRMLENASRDLVRRRLNG